MVTSSTHPWRVGHRTGTYWALTRAELAALAADAGLVGVRWVLPEADGFFQPLLIART